MFNKQRKTKNIALSSFSGALCNICNTVMLFVYRTVFLLFLSKEYLGLNGLFTNVLQIFSLMDLGISTIISYRLYEPIHNENINKVAAYLKLFRRIYFTIGAAIIILGAIFLPFLRYIVDFDEIPSDVNIYVIFSLFVLQSAVSYFCTYRQILISADQKGYIASVFSSVSTLTVNIFRIAVLYFTKNYTLVLAGGIAVQFLANIWYSSWVTKQYPEVFKCSEQLTGPEIKYLFKDTLAGMCHKVGGVVVSSTDSIILSRYISLGIVGIYSNYNLITTSIVTVFNSVFSNVTSSVGSYNIDATADDNEKVYLQMQFANLFMVWIVTVCVYLLINPFMMCWQGAEFVLPNSTVLFISIQFFMQSTNCVNMCFINATGLYVKDRIRPLIEAALNLAISIYLVKKIGISGVFIGTVVSGLTTYYWRQYYLLYRYVFRKGPGKIIALNLKMIIAGMISILLLKPLLAWFGVGWGAWLLKGVLCAGVSVTVFSLMFFKDSNFHELRRKLIPLLKKK